METKTIGGARVKLADQLPLKAPILIQMFPVYACNCKCEFCIYSLEKSKHGFMSDCINMDFGLYKKFVDDMLGYKTKMLRFAGTGEPLIHKNIADMVALAKKSDIAERVDIVSNGVLLNQKVSDELINAELDTLRISVNGLSSEDYKKHCDINLNFDDFVSNIKYFYDNKKDTKVYIKIIDYMVNTKELEEKFYSIFKPICDTINIEHLVEPVDCVDVSELGGELTKTQNGESLSTAEVCPQPFYMLQINPDGKIVPCCAMEYPAILGDINNEKIIDIFTGDKFNSFRRNLLLMHKNKICSRCVVYKYGIYREDILDNDIDKLLNLY